MKKYKRVLLKLSGESLMGKQNYGIDSQRLEQYAKDIKNVYDQGIEIAIVIGGGNIFRGLQGAANGIDRVQGDNMGMMATIINSLALQGALEKIDIPTALFGGLEVSPFVKRMSGKLAIDAINQQKVVIISGGTGNPFFTTDTASVLRALEIKADAMLKGTRVCGIYNEDPEKNRNAVKYNQLTYDEALKKGLKIMDLTAFALSKENDLDIVVFDMNTPGNFQKILHDPSLGTIVTKTLK